MQSAESLAALLELVVDPVTHASLVPVRRGSAVPTLLRSASHDYPVVRGIPHLVPCERDIVEAVGEQNYEAWRALQDAAEESYRVRVEGHFSTANYQPALDYGRELAEAPPGNYLDVGCGLLERPVYMDASHEKAFVGVDPMAIQATRSFPFARAFGDFLPFRNRCFDGVLFSSALDHCINPARALLQAHRVLRPGGALFVFETLRPDDKRFKQWRRQARLRPTQYNTHHNWAFTEESLLRTVARAGFVIAGVKRTSDPSEGVLMAYRPQGVRPRGVAARVSKLLMRAKSRPGRPRYIGPA